MLLKAIILVDTTCGKHEAPHCSMRDRALAEYCPCRVAAHGHPHFWICLCYHRFWPLLTLVFF